MTISDAELQDIVEGIVAAVWQSVEKKYGAELKSVGTRLAALEARPHMKYVGTWEPTKTYDVGDVATWDGSCWHAQEKQNGMRPGSSPGSWRLMVKRGADKK